MRLKPHSKSKLIAGNALIAVAVCIGVAYPQGPSSSGVPSGYVGGAVCANCHRQIANSYAQTGMGRSFYRPESRPVVENFASGTFFHSPSDTYFSMERRGSEVFQRRWQLGVDREAINIEEMRVDYVMGSGNHARSYLSRTAAGTLIELPLGWYPKTSSDAGGWGMSPGSDTERPMTRRFISYKCMFCHNAMPVIPEENVLPDADPVFSGDLPKGIDCQRCHGPGSSHVRIAGSPGAKLSDIRASIVNPKRLSAERQMDVCTQCHLETTSTRIPATLVRFNRGPFSFKPGEVFSDFALSFDHAPRTGHDDKFETVSSVYRLKQSKCFTASAGKLVCQTCHNPHQIPRGTEAAKQYSSVCSGCHSPAAMRDRPLHPSGADCISCHMPKRRADDIPRMVMTDHFIRKNPPLKLVDLPEPSRELYHGEIVPYDRSSLADNGENALYTAVAQVGLENNPDAGLARLQNEIEKRRPSEPQFYLVLGDALKAKGRLKEAATAYETALRLRPDSIRALRSLGTPDALKRAVELKPSDAESWYRYGLLDAEAGRLPPAIEKIRRAIALDPALPEKSRKLSEVLARSGNLAEAQAAVENELKINPYDDAAWDLAGRLHSEKQDIRHAIFAFEKAIKLSPDSASYLYDYGLALARSSRFEEAQLRAEAAIRRDDQLAEAHELLGGLFEQKQQALRAIAEYKRTIELKPGLGRTRLRLGYLMLEQGDRNGALEHLREATKSGDSAVSGQARQTLLRLGVR